MHVYNYLVINSDHWNIYICSMLSSLTLSCVLGSAYFLALLAEIFLLQKPRTESGAFPVTKHVVFTTELQASPHVDLN